MHYGLAIFFSLSALAVPATATELGKIVVQLKELKELTGTVHIGIEKSADDFDNGPITAVKYRGKQAKVTGNTLSITFEDIPYGTYAVKVYHDENNNDEHDTNFLGIPTESYGFSNDARGTFGPAKFDDAKFEFKQSGQIMNITME